MREEGPTSITTANAYCLSNVLKCHFFVVPVAKYIQSFRASGNQRYCRMKGSRESGCSLSQGHPGLLWSVTSKNKTKMDTNSPKPAASTVFKVHWEGDPPNKYLCIFFFKICCLCEGIIRPLLEFRIGNCSICPICSPPPLLCGASQNWNLFVESQRK